jgi:hypothetical protein
MIIRRSSSKYRNKRIRKRRQQHLCLDKGYNSEHKEQQLIIKRGYVLHIPIKKNKKGTNNEKDITRAILNIKRYSPTRDGL